MGRALGGAWIVKFPVVLLCFPTNTPTRKVQHVGGYEAHLHICVGARKGPQTSILPHRASRRVPHRALKQLHPFRVLIWVIKATRYGISRPWVLLTQWLRPQHCNRPFCWAVRVTRPRQTRPPPMGARECRHPATAPGQALGTAPLC